MDYIHLKAAVYNRRRKKWRRLKNWGVTYSKGRIVFRRLLCIMILCECAVFIWWNQGALTGLINETVSVTWEEAIETEAGRPESDKIERGITVDVTEKIVKFWHIRTEFIEESLREQMD